MRARASGATATLAERAEHGCTQAIAARALQRRPLMRVLQELQQVPRHSCEQCALPSCTTSASR